MKTCLFYCQCSVQSVDAGILRGPQFIPLLPHVIHTHTHTHTNKKHANTHFLSFIFSCALSLSLRVKKVSPNTTYFCSPFLL